MNELNDRIIKLEQKIDKDIQKLYKLKIAKKRLDMNGSDEIEVKDRTYSIVNIKNEINKDDLVKAFGIGQVQAKTSEAGMKVNEE